MSWNEKDQDRLPPRWNAHAPIPAHHLTATYKSAGIRVARVDKRYPYDAYPYDAVTAPRWAIIVVSAAQKLGLEAAPLLERANIDPDFKAALDAAALAHGLGTFLQSQGTKRKVSLVVPVHERENLNYRAIPGSRYARGRRPKR